MGLGARLGRGKNYAVSGQVTEMRLVGPHVVASVVGARESPYGVTIDFRVPEGAAREAIAAALRGECGMDDAVAAVKQGSRRYAKRQMTWLRKNPEIFWIDRSTAPTLSEETALCRRFLTDFDNA